VAGDPTGDSAAPHLIAGYGRAVLDGNVAIVQTTDAEIERAYQAQIDRDIGLTVEPPATTNVAQPEFAVDVDFLQALQQGTVNL
jgi:hypothetical protein